jgi:putative phosphoribosyl transferase
LPSNQESSETRVTISAGTIELEGELAIPRGARGIVLFAHGRGGSRLGGRNQFVAGVLRGHGLATLMLDLLTPDEEMQNEIDPSPDADVMRLGARVIEATDWIRGSPLTSGMRIGVYGASTGGVAALIAAAERPEAIAAVVSRGSRPDLAGTGLQAVQAPTLLIVGETDAPVLELNRRALDQMSGTRELAVVPGASHLFEEPGALEDVAQLASAWFGRHLLREGDASAGFGLDA